MKKFWNLVILVLAAALAWQLYQGGKLNTIRQDLISLMMPANRRLGPEPTTTVAPASTPVFAQESEPAAPEPEASATPFFAQGAESNTSTASSAPAQEAPAPVATPTPAPKVEEVDLASIDRRYWPKMVKLNKDMQFAIVDGKGSITGQVAAPSGVMVKLLDLRGAKLVVALATGSAPQPVEMADTDIQERLREIVKVVGSAGSIGSPSSSSASSTSSFGSPAGTGRSPAGNPASTPWVPKLGDRDRTPFNRR